MRFSLNFLKEIVGLKASAEEIDRRLTTAGLEVEKIEKAGSDRIFHVEVTTNRFDWLSVIGVAQEAAAVFGQKIKLEYPRLERLSQIKERKIFIEEKRDCPFYLAKQLEDIKVKDSPPRLRSLLLNSGLASVNNVVDVTNYCMLKWGNPLHAFDSDKIEGDVYVRRAKRGEGFIGIDGKKRDLTKENLVIADKKKVIALAGVMGAKNSEVTSETKNIFLEAALFSPITVRRSRRQAGLDTESSYRFERSSPSYFIQFASQEASDLIKKLAGGKLSGGLMVGSRPKEKTKKMTVSLSKMKNYLGADFRASEAERILKALNFKIKKVSADKIAVEPHSCRFDIEKPVDIYEEFARIYGYDKIKPKIPFLKKEGKRAAVLAEKESFWKFKNKIRDFIALSGFSEIVTYSLADRKELSLIEEGEYLSLENPLRGQDSLRPNLFLGMIKSAGHNLNRGKSDLKFFEIANIYKKEKNKIGEKTFLSLGVSGPRENFFLLKGLVLDLLNYLNIKGNGFKRAGRMSFSNALEFSAAGKVLGFLGKLDKKVQEDFSLKQELFMAAFDLSLLREKSRDKVFLSFSRLPAVSRDISVAVREDIKFAEIEKIIKEKSSYLSRLEMIDTYQGSDLGKGYRSFTLRLFYRSGQKTLSSPEVDASHNKMREELNAKEGITLR